MVDSILLCYKPTTILLINCCCRLSNNVNTGSRLLNTSDVKTRKRRNVIGIDMIFALVQTNNNTPNKLLLSESAVSCLLRVRSVSFTSRAKGCIKFAHHSCLMSIWHKVGVINIYELLDCKTIIYRQPPSMGYLIPWLVISLSKNKNNSHKFLLHDCFDCH
jgi:hypothetical protein